MLNNPAVELDLFLPACDPETDALHRATALYTRDAVVEQILDLAAWPGCGGRMLDPGAGDGSFINSALRRLCPRRNDVTTVVNRVEAWEIHPHAACAARERIVGTLVSMMWDRDSAETAAAAVVTEVDLLTAAPEQRYSLIAGNPPYLRFANLPPRYKAAYAHVVPPYARADLLYAFIDRCASMLAADGRLALVTADRWLFNEGAGTLRERVGSRLGIDALHRLDPSSAFYRPKQRRAGTSPRVHPVIVLLAPAARATLRLGRPAIHPDATTPAPPGQRLLGDVATIKLAPWLGPHGVFTISRDAAAAFPQHVLVPCVDTDDITPDGLGNPSRFALRTSRGVEPHPAVLAHLRATAKGLPPRARRVPEWCPPESWGTLPVDRDTILIPRIAKELRPVRLPAGVLPINHNLTIVAPLSCDLDALMDTLRSESCQTWIQQRAPRLENGYHSITTRLLRQLPVPPSR